GTYYYWLRAESGGTSSDWSSPVAVTIAPAGGWVVRPESDYDDAGLLAVQRALLRLCAARGDLFAVLALPEHYREADAVRHAGALTAATGPGYGGVGPLRFDEASTLSYGALYHPWLVGRDDQQPGGFRRQPPDGAASGVLARRALDRGAWVAPANE